MRNWHAGLTIMMLAALTRPAAAQSPPPKTLERIFEEFSSGDLEVKNKAGRDGLAYLEEWLRRDVDGMREALPVIMAAMQGSNPTIRVSGSALLGTLGYLRPRDVLAVIEGYEEEILAGFEDPNPQLRANLMRCLALAEPMPPLETIEPFKKALKGPPSEARRIAVIGLARAAPGSLAAADAIVELLDRIEDLEERRGVIQALAGAKPTHPVIIAKLVEQLDNENTLLRQSTIRTLAEIGMPAAQAIEKLRAIADDPDVDPQMRDNPASALRVIEGRPPPPPRPKP